MAVQNNYCRPQVDDSGVIQIREGRHPVVEKMLRDALFVSRLREALDLLGMDLALTVTASGGAELTISLGDESEVYRVPPHESSPLYALLIYAREVFSEAGLMPPIASPDDGRGIDLRLGRV